jgi:hypothetical protein
MLGNSKWRSIGLALFAGACAAWHVVEHFFEPWLTLAGM